MSYVVGLRCRECGARYPQKGVHVCEVCFGPLEVEYDYAAMKGRVTRASIETKPRNLWRYSDLLPCTGTPVTGHHSGFTPLRRARNDPYLLPLRTHISVYRRVRPHVSQIQRPRENRFHRARTGVVRKPTNLHIVTEPLLEPPLALPRKMIRQTPRTSRPLRKR